MFNKIEVYKDQIRFPKGLRVYDKENSSCTPALRLVLGKSSYDSIPELEIQQLKKVGKDEDNEDVEAWVEFEQFWIAGGSYKIERIKAMALYYLSQEFIKLKKENERLKHNQKTFWH